jgi:parallel beta-helix repeat protein
MTASLRRLRHIAAAAWLITFPAGACFSQVIHHPVSPHRPEPRHPISGRWPTFYISGCQEITVPGLYMLTADIDTGGAACMNIHATHSVTLDCSGYRITASNGIVPVMVQNATAVTVTNCSLSNQYISPRGTVTPYGLDIENSTDVAVTYNTIAGININGVSRGYVSDNQIVGYYEQYNSHGMTISQNSIAGVADEQGAAGIALNSGYSNQVLNNTMDGKWNRLPVTSLLDVNGWDDGIVLDNEAGDVISGNNIQNVWDAGIEGAYSLMNTVISGNTIQHIYGCAIGAWWYIDWVGNQVLNNQADDVAQLLTIFYADNTTPAPPSPTVHFENNLFVGNVVEQLSPINPVVGPRSEITIAPVPYIHYLQVQVDNNVLKDNNFGQNAPELIPATGFIDGGGNVCQTATDGSPITCHP